MQEKQENQSRFSGTTLILVAIFCLSIQPPMIRVGLTEDVSPIVLLAVRLLIASLMLWIIFGLRQVRVLRIDLRGVMACTVVAAADTFASLCYYYSFTHISTSIAHVVFSLYPVVALLLLSLRGERFSAPQVAGLVLALAGVFFLVGPGGEVSPVGLVLAFGAALGYAVTLTLTQWFLREYDPRTVALYVTSMMTVMAAVVWLTQGQTFGTVSAVGWTAILVIAVVSTAFARLILFAGIQRAGSGRTVLLAPVETLLAVTWAVLFLGDRLTWWQTVGGLLVLVSMNLVLARRTEKKLVSNSSAKSRWKSLFGEWI